jgi:hypothetical protein
MATTKSTSRILVYMESEDGKRDLIGETTMTIEFDPADPASLSEVLDAKPPCFVCGSDANLAATPQPC